MTARPWAKWAGGKSFLLPEILSRLPKSIETYHEPFVGGGAVFFAIASEKRFKRAMLGDANEELARTYNVIATQADALVRELKNEAYAYNEDLYYAARVLHPEELSPVKRAARFIYLNRTCFNGLYRVNSKGRFNTPFGGKYTNPTICDEENLRAVSKALEGVPISAVDFATRSGARHPKKGDAVYCDPPYAPLSETSNFTSYTKGGFGDQDQTRLAAWARRLDAEGVHVLLSNSDTSFVRGLYEGFRVEVVEAPRRMNSKGGKRGKVTELLISGKNA